MSRTAPLVSVVIPSYNRAHHLPECLKSVLDQSYPALEAIVVDDGSRDQTRELVAALRAADPRIQYLYQDNAGVSAARNAGLRAARGDFIALLDSDDAWLPGKLELQLAALRALPQAGMIWSDMTAVSETGVRLHERFLHKMYGAYEKLGGRPLFSQSITLEAPGIPGLETPTASVGYGNIYALILSGNLVHTSTVLLRRERALQAGFFHEQFRKGGEDYGFHLRTCRHGPVAFLDLPTVLYRVGCQDQLTHRRNQVDFARAFLATIEQELRENGERLPISRRQLQAIFADAKSWLGAELLANGERREALGYLAAAIGHEPVNHFAWGQLARAFLPQVFRRYLKQLLAPAPSESLA
jgi:glycosyltransferase involved in cell wall biosynthesis